MEEWKLTGKEIYAIGEDCHWAQGCSGVPVYMEELLKASQKKLVEWGDTICMEHGMKKRRRCDRCWREVCKSLEVKDGK